MALIQQIVITPGHHVGGHVTVTRDQAADVGLLLVHDTWLTQVYTVLGGQVQTGHVEWLPGHHTWTYGHFIHVFQFLGAD